MDEVPNKALSCNVCPRAGGKSVGIIIPPGFQVTRNGWHATLWMATLHVYVLSVYLKLCMWLDLQTFFLCVCILQTIKDWKKQGLLLLIFATCNWSQDFMGVHTLELIKDRENLVNRSPSSSLVPRLSPCVNGKFSILQVTESWAGPGNEATHHLRLSI